MVDGLSSRAFSSSRHAQLINKSLTITLNVACIEEIIIIEI